MVALQDVSVEGESFSEDDTFYRALIKGKYKKDGTRVAPRAFASNRVSVDWSKFAEPCETAGRIDTTDPKLLPIKVASVTARSIWDCLRHILHDPLTDNYSHCLIMVDSSQPICALDKARVKLARAAKIVYTRE